MEFGPILRALMRNKTGAILIALQCAITLAILVNALYIIESRITKINRPTGLDEANQFSLESIGFVQGFNIQNAIHQDLATLRAIPGVREATVINAIPQSSSGSSSSFRPVAEEGKQETGAAYYSIDDHGLEALGLKLVAGRNFRAEEILEVPERTTEYPHQAIISQELANTLFPPDGQAVGKTLYTGRDNAVNIIGVVERMQSPWINWGKFEQSILLPAILLTNPVRYFIRTEPGRRDELMPVVEQTLQKLNSGRIIRELRSQSDLKTKIYSSDRAMAIILGSVVILIVCITTLGIVGLATFSVRRRTKQIGTRRALGARKRDILRYFMLENWLITSAGVVLGTGFAFALNYWLVKTFSLPRLDWHYVPLGILFMWAMGLAAVFAPARRASLIPPATATRSV